MSATGSFSTVGGTGSFAPVGDELVSDVAPEERYIDDADDSAYDEEYTETGAFAGPGYVDMPKSRAGRLFSRFRKGKKRKEEEVSVNEWVDVDEDYNARSVGKARGDWSSFREEDDEFVDVDYRESDDRRGWNGGAFSLNRLRKGEDAQVEDTYYDESAVYDTDGIVMPAPHCASMVTLAQPSKSTANSRNFRTSAIPTSTPKYGLLALVQSSILIRALMRSWKSTPMR